MGTRADFYAGRGEQAEWLGSIAWDGYPSGLNGLDLKAPTLEAWRASVASFIAGRDDGTKPDDGWPWPWNDSGTTDYAYAFDGGKVWGSCFGATWFDAGQDEPEDHDDEKMPFPNMASRKAVTLGKRSGLIVVQVRPEVSP